jgi:hypothetical protein
MTDLKSRPTHIKQRRKYNIVDSLKGGGFSVACKLPIVLESR